MYIEYTDKETGYLKSRDKVLGEAIDRIGHVNREADPDLYFSVVRAIIGQQISTAAQTTIVGRLQDTHGEITPAVLHAIPAETLQKIGISFRKADYIKSFTEKVITGECDLLGLYEKSDGEVIRELSALQGIGVWTAEMLLLFCMRRPDIVSYGDLAILRGMRMLYHHRKIDPKLFRKYQRRYSPYGSVASLYLWAIAGGAIPEMRDYAPKAPPKAKPKAKR